MDTPFQYSSCVTGKHFIGRHNDCNVLSNLLNAGECIALWGPPKTGKMSALQQTFINMKTSGKQFVLCDIDLLNIRDIDVFLRKFAGEVLSAVTPSPDEYREITEKYLAGTGLDFNPVTYSDTGNIFGTECEFSRESMDVIADLPFALSRDKGITLIVLFREFENIYSDRGEYFFKSMEKAISENHQQGNRSCLFIFTGSRVNAMEDIFSHRKFFWRIVERYSLTTISDNEISEHVLKGFMAGGKVLDRELLQGVIHLFKNNIWYINHFFFICDALSKGYISEITLNDALACMLSVHTPKFFSIMSDLTAFQERFLKAILDGNVKFSTAEVIAKYRLNSSANVKRLRDALMKKEVVRFNEKDEPEIMDPLFEYWLRKEYFKTEGK